MFSPSNQIGVINRLFFNFSCHDNISFAAMATPYKDISGMLIGVVNTSLIAPT
jgi:hypothetical protein